MKCTRWFFWSWVLVLVFAPAAIAQEVPGWEKQIAPFFKKYCVECHNEKKPRGGLNLETHQSLNEGGDHGAAIVAGDADESRLVQMLEGLNETKMPPENAKLQPKEKEIALVRAWVQAGARLDQEAARVVLPAIKSKVKVSPPVAALAYLPDGKHLVAGNYKEIVLCDTVKGEVVGKLTGLPQPVSALAVSKDGKRLAVALGQSGEAAQIRIYPLPAGGLVWGKPRQLAKAHADMILQLAFSPDGTQLISGGYDRLVKIWDAASGKNLETFKEHSDSVYGVAYRPDGKLFATAGADRAVKVWQASGKLLYTLSEATDWIYAVAWSADGKHLAAAGVDKSIRTWKADETEAKIVHSVFAHQAPVLRLVYSTDGKTLFSLSEDRILKVWDAAKMVERHVYAAQPEAALALAVHPQGKQVALGRYDGALLLLDEVGKVQAQPLPAKDKNTPAIQVAVLEQEPNNSPGTGQIITVPTLVTGTIDRAGDVDFFRFEAKTGQQFGVRATVGQDKGKAVMDPFLQLTDGTGKVLTQSNDGFLGYTFSQDGWYALGIRDRDFGGNDKMTYQLQIGDVPVVTSVFPLGLQQGTAAKIQIEGVNLDGITSVPVKADKVQAGSKMPIPLSISKGAPLGLPQLAVGEFPEVLEQPGAVLDMPVPGTANGVISKPGETDLWRFHARKGEKQVIEVIARRLGSELDSFIEILDAQGKPVPLATLRSLAKTYVTFRDHNSVQPNIRIEAWSELAVNDYIYVGTQLLKIKALPAHPDADCNFFSVKGQRLGYLGTTTTHLAKDEPMYKVSIHPPGTVFPPNGFPVIDLFYRNDDGGAGFGRDSRLVFDAPADGEYQVRIGDSTGQGGRNYAYRLTIRPPQPSFNVRFNPPNPSVWKGGAVPITVTADRIDGFNGPIKVWFANLPAGFSAPVTEVLPDEENTVFALWAAPDAKTPDKIADLKLMAEATINGQTIRREATGGKLQAVAPGEIITTTEQSEVTIKPGGQARLTLNIERRGDFKGRVPINVQGLPHGVKVLDIGLNGILITEKETRRTIVFYCEPWVQAVEHPIVITANREGKNTQHSARSVLLKVAGE